jgi:hypothetical protein
MESKHRVNLSMIMCHVTKLMMNLSQLSRLNLGSMLPEYRIKFFGLIECGKLYL